MKTVLGCLLIVILAIAATVFGTGYNRRDAARALQRAGYQLVAPPSVSFGMCMKGRQAFGFRAWRDGRPVKGKVCAGGFLAPSISEGAWL